MKLQFDSPKKPRIEIVPMIDTVFFLLVYFMIATLNMTKLNAQKVSLPYSATASAKPQANIVVTVAKDGRCYIDHDLVAEMNIPAELDHRLLVNQNAAIVINCDKDQPVDQFAQVFDLVKQSDAVMVMVATTPKADWATKQ